MKEFRCGDVVAGCQARFTGSTDDEILKAVAEHAREGHGLTEVPPSLVDQVVAAIRTTAV
ncbi:MAG: DUF1059 domain-containing protein [Vicinamibacteria bacterium]